MIRVYIVNHYLKSAINFYRAKGDHEGSDAPSGVIKGFKFLPEISTLYSEEVPFLP